jgi:hypothetical protein
VHSLSRLCTSIHPLRLLSAFIPSVHHVHLDPSIAPLYLLRHSTADPLNSLSTFRAKPPIVQVGHYGQPTVTTRATKRKRTEVLISNTCRESVTGADRTNTPRRTGTMRGTSVTTVARQVTDRQCALPSTLESRQLRKQQPPQMGRPLRRHLLQHQKQQHQQAQTLRPRITRHRQTCWPN